MAQGVLDPPTEHQRDLARRELARRRALSEAKRGGPLSPEHRQSISNGLKRSWAERRAAIEAVMREAEAREGVAADALHE